MVMTSTERIAHTCPTVEDIVARALRDATDAIERIESEIKDEVTYPFREALDDACSELESALEEVDELKKQVEQLTEERDSLKQRLETAFANQLPLFILEEDNGRDYASA